MNVQSELLPYLDYCQYRKELNPKTIKAYRIDLRQFFDYMSGKEHNKSNLETFITFLHKTYKQKTVKRKIASLKAFYNYLEEEEILEGSSPLHKIKVKFKEAVILPRIIPRDIIEKLLTYMYCELYCNTYRKPHVIIRDICVIEMLFSTGMRVSELSNLKVENVDLASGVIKIMGKGSKERYIQLANKDVQNLLQDYYGVNKEKLENKEYFFANEAGSRLTEQSIRIMLSKYVKRAGIKMHITPHMFRHSAATYLLEEGVDIVYIQKLLGHSSIKTTQIYLYIALEKQAEVLREKHPRNKMNITRLGRS